MTIFVKRGQGKESLFVTKPDSNADIGSVTAGDFQTGSEAETETADADSDSQSEIPASMELENTPTACRDGQDNDGDGLADCDDVECLATKACECLNGQVRKVACGSLCGEPQRICVDGHWGSPDQCQNEGLCEPGEKIEDDCGPCEVRKKTCRKDCSWGDWGKCEDIHGCITYGGVAYEGQCWYMGAAGESSLKNMRKPWRLLGRDQKKYVETPDQGGSLKHCQALFDALGYSKKVVVGVRYDGRGLGCHACPDVGFCWLTSPRFDPSASLSGAHMVCTCNE